MLRPKNIVDDIVGNVETIADKVTKRTERDSQGVQLFNVAIISSIIFLLCSLSPQTAVRQYGGYTALACTFIAVFVYMIEFLNFSNDTLEITFSDFGFIFFFMALVALSTGIAAYFSQNNTSYLPIFLAVHVVVFAAFGILYTIEDVQTSYKIKEVDDTSSSSSSSSSGSSSNSSSSSSSSSSSEECSSSSEECSSSSSSAAANMFNGTRKRTSAF